MSYLRTVRLRPAARQLLDIEVPEAAWKQDFDIADRYQAFANELLRIALLGIGGYVVLIRELLTAGSPICHQLLRENDVWLGSGVISLMISAGMVLAHRFSSTACLYHQVMIVRSLKRLENTGWTDKEKLEEKKFLTRTRKEQRSKYWLSRILLICSTTFFAGGFICVIAVSLRAFKFA